MSDITVIFQQILKMFSGQLFYRTLVISCFYEGQENFMYLKKEKKNRKALKDTKLKANENTDNNACHINYTIAKTVIS